MLHYSNTYYEKTLLSQAAEGDEQAFRLLFIRHQQKVAAFILRLTESRMLTQEIVQDVFIKIWLTRSRLQDVVSFEPYLFRIARNHTLNCIRQQAREQLQKSKWLKSQTATDQYPAYQDADPTALLEEAVRMLPPRQQEVYILSRYQRLGQKEIARQMAVSTATVKKHMVLALRFLKTYVRANLKTWLLLLFSFLLK